MEKICKVHNYDSAKLPNYQTWISTIQKALDKNKLELLPGILYCHNWIKYVIFFIYQFGYFLLVLSFVYLLTNTVYKIYGYIFILLYYSNVMIFWTEIADLPEPVVPEIVLKKKQEPPKNTSQGNGLPYTEGSSNLYPYQNNNKSEFLRLK